MNLKDKTVCIYDTGFFIPLAEKLAKSNKFKEVLYFNPYEDGYYGVNDSLVGLGIKGIDVIENPLEAMNDIDLYIFTDCVFSDLQEHLKKLGKNVVGCGNTNWIEQDRARFREWQKKNGMPIPEYKVIKGIDNLQKELTPDSYIKISRYRRDMETMRFIDKARSEQRFDDLKVRFGAYKNKMDFIVEKKINGVEIGYDGWSANGMFPEICLQGIEIKDKGYVGKVVRNENLWKPLKYTNDMVGQIFKEEQTKSIYSSEVRFNGKDSYLLDPTIRFPNPPFQAHLELWKNLPEILWGLSQGQIIKPIPTALYVAIVIIYSDFATYNQVSIRIPKGKERWVKLMNYYIVDGEPVVLPIYGLSEIGAVVGIGMTKDEAINNCKKNAEGIEGDSLDIDVDVFNEADKTLKEMEKYGLKF